MEYTIIVIYDSDAQVTNVYEEVLDIPKCKLLIANCPNHALRLLEEHQVKIFIADNYFYTHESEVMWLNQVRQRYKGYFILTCGAFINHVDYSDWGIEIIFPKPFQFQKFIQCLTQYSSELN